MYLGEALGATRAGEKVARVGWNGKDMWIAQEAGVKSLDSEKFWNKHTRKFAEENGGSAEVLPYMIMKPAHKHLIGWLASQSDMAADDWEVVS